MHLFIFLQCLLFIGSLPLLTGFAIERRTDQITQFKNKLFNYLSHYRGPNDDMLVQLDRRGPFVPSYSGDAIYAADQFWSMAQSAGHTNLGTSENPDMRLLDVKKFKEYVIFAWDNSNVPSDIFFMISTNGTWVLRITVQEGQNIWKGILRDCEVTKKRPNDNGYTTDTFKNRIWQPYLNRGGSIKSLYAFADSVQEKGGTLIHMGMVLQKEWNTDQFGINQSLFGLIARRIRSNARWPRSAEFKTVRRILWANEVSPFKNKKNERFLLSFMYTGTSWTGTAMFGPQLAGFYRSPEYTMPSHEDTGNPDNGDDHEGTDIPSDDDDHCDDYDAGVDMMDYVMDGDYIAGLHDSPILESGPDVDMTGCDEEFDKILDGIMADISSQAVPEEATPSPEPSSDIPSPEPIHSPEPSSEAPSPEAAPRLEIMKAPEALVPNAPPPPGRGSSKFHPFSTHRNKIIPFHSSGRESQSVIVIVLAQVGFIPLEYPLSFFRGKSREEALRQVKARLKTSVDRLMKEAERVKKANEAGLPKEAISQEMTPPGVRLITLVSTYNTGDIWGARFIQDVLKIAREVTVPIFGSEKNVVDLINPIPGTLADEGRLVIQTAKEDWTLNNRNPPQLFAIRYDNVNQYGVSFLIEDLWDEYVTFKYACPVDGIDTCVWPKP
ncbi:hypothetical protein N7492_009752 [Penicillium capsulatum]|uniref:Uncharacterized protein n=1 Tax=Penicillium capsulatum TaxID=69766 RepID=A0A9W9HPI4_9EURO|nr:hypothetical protein N7492_009752 [Penicillium capsulatum]